jgi:hypothetical protein
VYVVARRTVREKDRCITKQEVTLRQLEEIVSVAPVVYESRSSQTEVDDDGLWDVQVRGQCTVPMVRRDADA